MSDFRLYCIPLAPREKALPLAEREAYIIPRALIMAMLIALPWCGLSNGAEPIEPTPVANSPLQFRRVYVPANRIKELAGGCLPRKLEEFERLVKQMESAPTARTSGAVITRAEYSARLEHQQLVGGEARLEVAREAGAEAAISFDASRLAIANPMWDESPPRPATLALAADGQVVLLVEKPGRLKFPWTLRGAENVLGGVEFELALPPCASNRLTLDLPAGLAPVVDRGLVAPAKNAGGTAPRPTGRRTWTIELGGNSRFLLRIAPEQSLTRPQQITLLRESLNYRLSTNGLSLSADLRLDVYHEPLRRLVLRPAAGLHLTSARFRDQPLSISTLPSATGPPQVVVEFPEPILGSDRQIQLTGVGPIVTGEKWKLPALRVEGAIWQEGSTALAVLEPLALQDVLAIQGRQSKVKSLPPSSPGELLEFQSFGSDAAIEVQVARPANRLKLLAGTTITFGSAAVTGVTKAEITALQGERFELSCNLTRLWVIDSLETEPASLLDDWGIVAADARWQRVKLRLKKPLDAKQPVRVVVRAHRQPTARGTPLSVEQLRLAEFQDATESRHLVLARAEPPHRLEAAGDSELERVDPARLLPLEADLLERDSTGLVFQDGPGAARLQLSLEDERPSYSVDAFVEAVIDGESLTEEYRLRCRPESSRVSRILVHFSQAREPELAWKILGQEDRDTVSRRLSEEEQRLMSLIGGETWELVFLRPRGEPFEARAQRTSRLRGKTPLALASIPEAESQTGELSIAATDGAHPAIDGQSLPAIPARPAAAGRYSNVRALYRYEPSQGGQVTVAPAISGGGQSLAWAWSCLLTSRYSAGKASHAARYLVENQGRGHLTFTIPRGVVLEQIHVNETELPPPALNETDRMFVVPLPPGIRYPIVSLVLTSEREALPSWGAGQLAPTLPTTDFPVLERRWTLWLPRELAVVTAGESGHKSNTISNVLGERLFGPLRGGASAEPFDPLNAAAWRGLIVRPQSLDVQAKSARCLSALGSLASRANSGLTWSELLKEYLTAKIGEDDTPPPRLLLDEAALAACGIGPRTIIPSTRGQSPSEAGAGLLAAANLRLVEHGEEIVLTSPLSSSLVPNQAIAPQAVTIAQWLAGDGLPPSPWEKLPPAPFAALAVADWTSQSFEIPSSGQLFIRVYRPQAILTTAWGLLFVVAILAWGVGARRPRRLIALAAVAGLSALLADDLYLPLGTAAFLGVLLGGLLLLAWRIGRRRPTWIEDVSTRTMSPAVPSPATLLGWGVLATLCTAAIAARAWAADPPVKSDKEPSQLFPVYIPVDDKQQPTSGYVHLPPALYEAIERAVAAGAPTRAWLVPSAVYQCQLDRAGGGGKLSVTELTAKFDIDVLQAKTRVSLAMKKLGVHLFSDRARLDGQPVQVDWSDDGERLEFSVEQAGKHVLELALQPTLEADASSGGFSVAIPRVPRARFKVAVPSGVEGVTSPLALGASDADLETGELLIDLGPADNLSLRWPVPGGAAIPPAELDVDQQLWLKVRPGSVVIDGKFKFTLGEGRLREVRLLADPRWRLLPPRADQPIARYRVDEGSPQTILIELKTPYASEASLNLSFLLSGASGVGNIVLPRLEAVADRSSRRWLGITLDGELAAEIPPAAADTAIVPAEFLRVWGKGSGAAPLVEPMAAYRLSRGETNWSLAARPKQPQVSGGSRLDVSYGAGAAKVQWEADLVTAGGALFQQKLQLPPNLEIESVTVRQGTVERAARWSRPSRDSATVFFTGPLTGEHRMMVRGTLAKPNQGSWPVPRLELAGAKMNTGHIHLYCQPETRAIVTAPRGYRPDTESTVGEFREGFGRLAAAFTREMETAGKQAPSKPSPPPMVVTLEANAPETNCRLVTTMLRKSGGWSAEVECRLHVESGTLDAVRLEVPAEWKGPYELDPPADMQITELPGQSRRRLLVRPAAPLAGDVVLRIRGPLSTGPQGRVALPEVSLLDMDKLERFLVVPTQLEAQQIAWETSGLQAAPLPAETKARFPANESFTAYQVIGASFQASVKHVERMLGKPRVRLGDIHVAWQMDGSCHGVAFFDLEPAGLRHCLLEMPEHLELVYADVAELPALLAPAGGNAWRLELGPDQMPQRISVAFQGGVPHEESPPARLRFAAPSLRDIPVEQTLWTIHAPADRRNGRMILAGGETDALRQEVLRYTTAAALVERAADLALENSSREVADWYAPWSDRLALSRRAIDVLRIEAQAPNFASAEISSVDRVLEDLALRLKGTPSDQANRRLAAGRRQVFETTETGGTETAHLAFSGAQTTVEVKYVRTPTGDLVARVMSVVVLMAAALVLYLLASRGQLGEWLARWPHACGAAVGIVWWLFLAPSVLGLALVAVSFLGAFRSPWKTARTRQDPLTHRTGAPRPVAR